MPDLIVPKKLKYFYDTEFIEDGITIDPISIGIVSDDNPARTYYALNYECDYSKADEWVWKNVISKLPPKPTVLNPNDPTQSEWKTKIQIAEEVLRFCSFENKKPVFYADYDEYDHVLLCQLYGKMVDLPENFPMRTNDLRQTIEELGNPSLPENVNEHHALGDAIWLRKIYYFLKESYAHPAFIDREEIYQ